MANPIRGSFETAVLEGDSIQGRDAVVETQDERNSRTSKSIYQYLTRPLVITMVANILGVFQFGYSAGVITNSQDVIQDFINETIYKREGLEPSDTFLTNVWALIVAIAFFGGGLGSLSNQWVAVRMSRKSAHLLNVALGIVLSILLFSVRHIGYWEVLLLGRFLFGFHTGLYSSIATTHLTEISPKELRGALNSTQVFGMYMGIFVSQVLGFPDLLGTDTLWDVLYGLSLVPCLVILILMPFCVESPRYLMIDRGDEGAARRALQVLRRREDVQDEIDEMKAEIKEEKGSGAYLLGEVYGDHGLPGRQDPHLGYGKQSNTFGITWLRHCRKEVKIGYPTDGFPMVSFLGLFKHRAYREPTILAVIVHIVVQISGLVGVLFYANSVFQEFLGLSPSNASYMASSVGAMCVIMNLLVNPLFEIVGRRTLQLTGLAGLILGNCLITMTLALRHQVGAFGIVTIVIMFSIIIFFHIGPGPIPWILAGELFSQEARPLGSALAITVDYFGGFVVSYLFPPMQKMLKDFVFLPFAVGQICAFAYLYYNLPETKGKTIQEITTLFERPKHMRRGTVAEDTSTEIYSLGV